LIGDAALGNMQCGVCPIELEQIWKNIVSAWRKSAILESVTRGHAKRRELCGQFGLRQQKM